MKWGCKVTIKKYILQIVEFQLLKIEILFLISKSSMEYFHKIMKFLHILQTSYPYVCH